MTFFHFSLDDIAVGVLAQVLPGGVLALVLPFLSALFWQFPRGSVSASVVKSGLPRYPGTFDTSSQER